MDSTTAARVFMGDSLGFHIIFVMFSLGLPVLVTWFEWMSIRKKDQKLRDLAHKWSRAMAILVIAGVISGTIVALQMSLVWPGVLKFGGEVIGLPFMFETYAFLIEAVFLALYMSSWHKPKTSPKRHIFYGIVVAVSGAVTAFVITSVNAWINNPTGFRLVNGKFEDVNVWRAMFSVTSVVEFFHSLPAYFLATSLTVAGIYAWPIFKAKIGQRSSSEFDTNRLVVRKLMNFSALMLLMTVIMGHLSGVYLAKYEPVKLAAIELHQNTSANAPLIVGGVAGADGFVTGPHVKIPYGLSILSGDRPSKVVKGLNDFPKSQQPPLYIHVLFDLKMLAISIITAVLVAYFVTKKYFNKFASSKIMLAGTVVSGLLAVIVIELGWMLTEIGRQPWAVRGYVLTKDAVTQTHDVTKFGYLFPFSYLILFVVTAFALKKIAIKPKGSN